MSALILRRPDPSLRSCLAQGNSVVLFYLSVQNLSPHGSVCFPTLSPAFSHYCKTAWMRLLIQSPTAWFGSPGVESEPSSLWTPSPSSALFSPGGASVKSSHSSTAQPLKGLREQPDLLPGPQAQPSSCIFSTSTRRLTDI